MSNDNDHEQQDHDDLMQGWAFQTQLEERRAVEHGGTDEKEQEVNDGD